MLTFIELLIGVVVIVGVARYIIKGYSATGDDYDAVWICRLHDPYRRE